MIHTVKAVRTLQTVACFLGLAILLWSLGIPTSVYKADAANLTSVSDTLSDSDRGVVSNHTIRFTTPNGVLDTQTIVITFPGAFTLPSGLDFNDMDVTDDGQEVTLAGSPSGTTWGVSTTTSTIVFTTSTTSGASVGSSSVIVIEIGTNATTAGTGNTQLINPAAAGSVEITIGGSMVDSGSTRVAIIDDVDVTANVDTTLTFTIAGVANGQAVNGSPTTTSTTTTATTLPFESLSANTSKVLAQDLTVTTNASNGFVVTVAQSQNLLSSTGADIDGFANGNYNNSPIAWASPSATIANENTWGHWGLTSEDDLNINEFGTDLWVAASTTPRQIFAHTGPSDGTTSNQGATRVGYQAQISSLQEAGDDYSTTLTYVATPTF
jgi:hypothetical protein